MSEPAASSAAICDPISQACYSCSKVKGTRFTLSLQLRLPCYSHRATFTQVQHKYTHHTHTLGLIDRRHNRHRPLHLQLDRIALISACLSAATALTLMLAGKPP